jgi:hypothetical protein
VNIVAVSQERHGGKGWRQAAGYAFAATQFAVPLVGAEFASAAVAMPIAFMQGEGCYVPVAVTSPLQGRNLFVAPSGQWLGSYVPAALRTYPFRLGRGQGSSQVVFCVDEDSGWVVDVGATDGVARFFEKDSSPSAAARALFGFLQQIEQNRATTEVAVTGLAEAGVIQPWRLQVNDGSQRVEVKGLYRVDAAALAALDDETFLKLRKSSALMLAHSQLISMQTIGIFQRLRALQQQQAARQARPLPPASLLFGVDDGGTIQFGVDDPGTIQFKVDDPGTIQFD